MTKRYKVRVKDDVPEMIKRKHVEEIMFELKSGMVFQDTSDRYGMFIEVNGAVAALHLSGRKRFETYTPSRGNIPDGRRYKKIWEPTHVYDLTEQGREHLITTPPVWTNELEKVELTLEEVANKFGIDVELLRIKD